MDAQLVASNKHPVCFVSYSRHDADCDPELLNFVTMLRVELQSRTGIESKYVVFQDVSNLSPGDHWELELMSALNTADVFVAMYSPTYFAKFEKPCNCGREFSAFWERSAPDHKRNNILAVLWAIPGPGEEFPPPAVKSTSYSLPFKPDGADLDTLQVYNRQGLRRLRMRRGKRKYSNVVFDIADQILAMRCQSLPNLPSLLAFDGVPCHFHSEHEEQDLFPLCSPDFIRSGCGPARVVLIYAADGDRIAPEVVDIGMMTRIFTRENQVQGLRWLTTEGLDKVVATVQRAAQETQIPVVILPGTYMQDANFKALINKLIHTTGWIGGIVTVGAGLPAFSGTESVRLIDLTGGDSNSTVVILQLLADIRATLNRVAPVHQPPPDGPGPEQVPRL